MSHIEQISVEHAILIRQEAMYPNEKAEVVQLEEDGRGIHFGLFDQNRLISVVSWFRRSETHAQFRKMATLEEFRNKGYGSELLSYIINFSIDENIEVLWCNARLSASKFYRRHHFIETGPIITKNGIDFVIMHNMLANTRQAV